MARTVQLTFNQSTGVLTSDATTAIDLFSTTFHCSPISGATMDLVAQMSVSVGGVKISNPFARFNASGDCMMPAYLAKAVNGSVELGLRITYDTGIIENSSQIILDTVYAPDVMATAGDTDLILMRNSSWEYVSTWNYAKGSIVLYNDMLYTSLKDNNKGNVPSATSSYWTPSVDASQISITIDDTVTSTSSHAVRSSGIASYVDGKVSAVDAKIPENPASISNVNDAFEAEKTSRELADSGLSTLISSERTRALEAETTLQANIDAKTISLDTEVTATSQNGVTSAGIASYVSGQMTDVVKTTSGKIPSSVLPDIAISEYKGTVATEADLSSLTAETGDWAVVTGVGTFIKSTDNGWIKISSPASSVEWGKISGSIASQTDLASLVSTAKTEAITASDNYADTQVSSLKSVVDTHTSSISQLGTRLTTVEGAYASKDDVATAKSEAVSDAESYVAQHYQIAGSYATVSQVDAAQNNAVTVSEAYADGLVKDMATTSDVSTAKDTAIATAKSYTDGQISSLSATVHDTYQTKLTADTDYLTPATAEATYAKIGSTAGVTKEEGDTYWAPLGPDYAVKSDIPTDYLTSTDKSDLEGKISTAESNAKGYTDTEISGLSSKYLTIEDAGKTYATDANAQSYASTAGSNALSDAKSYVDGKGYAKATDVADTYATKTDLKAVTDDYLTSTDKTTIESDISNAKDGAVSTAESYTDGKVSTAKSEANTYTDGAISTLHTTVSGEIATAVSSTYKVKGSCKYSELPSDPSVGDVWNITEAFTVETITYPAGTNVVWTDSGWDILAGTYDLSVYTKTADLPTTVIASTEPTQVVGSVWIDTSED